MSIEMRNIILDLKRLGKTSGQISQTLSEVYGYSVTRFGVYKSIRRTYSGCKDRKPRGRKFTDGHRKVINLWMSQNNDLAARDIQKLFEKDMDICFSLSTIKKHKLQLKWTAKQKKYCQLISAKNKIFRMNWCLEKLSIKETFSNVIFVDDQEPIQG